MTIKDETKKDDCRSVKQGKKQRSWGGGRTFIRKRTTIKNRLPAFILTNYKIGKDKLTLPHFKTVQPMKTYQDQDLTALEGRKPISPLPAHIGSSHMVW